MTRKQALYEIEDYDEFSPNKNPSRIVNEIFDYFEKRNEVWATITRICKNCIHYTHNKYPDQSECDEGISMDEDINILEPNFGCNMFSSGEIYSKPFAYIGGGENPPTCTECGEECTMTGCYNKNCISYSNKVNSVDFTQ